ncbi:hypothetical protein, partial [Bilophila wadsworthia]
ITYIHGFYKSCTICLGSLSHALCPKFAEFGRKNQFGGDCDPEQGRHHQQVDDERQLAGYHRKQTFR